MSTKTNSESNSSHKPELFVDLIKNSKDIKIISSFEPVSKEDLEKAHSTNYIYNIFNRTIPNGFMNYDINVANSSLWTIGSLLAGSEYALKNKEITCSPTSGFHHARYEDAAGYCTFNGLIVVSQLISLKYNKKVAILDCDYHHGDGTDQIIDHLKLQNISNYSLGKNFKKDSNPKSYLEELIYISRYINENYDFVIYQAGADLHIEDPLGGILSIEELKQRDKIIKENIKIPMCWNLAGGYHDDYSITLNIHKNTLDILKD